MRSLQSVSHLPTFRPLMQGQLVNGPIVQRGGIKIRAIRPHLGVHFWINSHLVENIEIVQRRIQFSGKHRLKIDCLSDSVVKAQSQPVRSDDLKFDNFVNRMAHASILAAQSAPAFFLPVTPASRPEVPADVIQPSIQGAPDPE